MTSPRIVVAGAGMAGLVTAVAAQESGAEVVLLEKGPAPGGSLVTVRQIPLGSPIK